MKRRLTEDKALALLQRLKSSFQHLIKKNYEHKARDCKTCPTPGICCTDAHFVNVHITRLEAVAIRRTLERSPRLTSQQRSEVYERAREAVERYRLSDSGDTFKQTYSCPLFNSRFGCLVHQRAKPAPCIQHACYDVWQDLPPNQLETRTNHRVERLNQGVYGDDWSWLPIPVWLSRIDAEHKQFPETDIPGPRIERRLRPSLPIIR